MKHVLVIDDDPACRQRMESLLSGGGFEVTPTSGAEGRAMLDVVRPSCVVVSTTLAGGHAGALDLVRDMRSRDPRVGIVIVANGDLDVVDREVSGLDVWAVVKKPDRLDDLPDKVQAACEFAAISLDDRARLAEGIQTELMRFERTRRSTSSALRPAAPGAEGP